MSHHLNKTNTVNFRYHTVIFFINYIFWLPYWFFDTIYWLAYGHWTTWILSLFIYNRVWAIGGRKESNEGLSYKQRFNSAKWLHDYISATFFFIIIICICKKGDKKIGLVPPCGLFVYNPCSNLFFHLKFQKAGSIPKTD